jgi:hypothetical protein
LEFETGFTIETDINIPAGQGIALNNAIANAAPGVITRIYLNSDLPGHPPTPTPTRTPGFATEYRIPPIIIDGNRHIVIYGQGAFITSSSSSQLFFITGSGSLEIANATMYGGRVINTGTGAYGGAFFNDGRLAIRDSRLINNYAENGGGAIYNRGLLRLRRVELASNLDSAVTASGGGAAIQNDRGGRVDVLCSHFHSNKANYGSAILNGQSNNTTGTVLVRHSAFSNNTTTAGSLVPLSTDGFNFTVNPQTALDLRNNWWANGTPDVIHGLTVDALAADPTLPIAGTNTYANEACRPVDPLSCPSNQECTVIFPTPTIAPPIDYSNISAGIFDISELNTPPIDSSIMLSLSNQIGNIYQNGGDFRQVFHTSGYYGDCNSSNQINCAKYTYATFYAFLQVFTYRPPTFWDVLSAAYHLELGVVGSNPIAFEAFARNFFDSQSGGCRFNQAANTFNCSYSNFVTWLAQTDWINATALDNGLAYTNLQRSIGDGNGELIGLYTATNPSTYNVGSFRGAIDSGSRFNVGIFAHDRSLLDQISQNLNVWRTGQSTNYPSIWGNMILTPPGTTVYPTAIPIQQIKFQRISHFFSINGQLIEQFNGQNTIQRGNDTYQPYCTHWFVISTSSGRLPSLSNC